LLPRANEPIRGSIFRVATRRNIAPDVRGADHPLQVGDRAPTLDRLVSTDLDEERGQEQRADAPTVVALFGGDDAPTSEGEREAIRADLRALGAVLIAVSPRWLWVFRPEEERQFLESPSPALREGLPRLFARFGVPLDERRAGLGGLFVVDGDDFVRFAHRVGPGERITLGTAVQAASRAMLLPPDCRTGASRREFLLFSLLTGFAVAVADGCAPAPPLRDAGSIPRAAVDLTLEINGQRRALRVEPRVSLLDALREQLALTGTKKGCDHGQCGACTVLIDGRRVLSCLTLAVTAADAKVTTIEGLGSPEALHPMQAAFVAEDALQCGYCTPGQIMSAVGMVSEGHAKDDGDIRELMSGNICRCGAYPNIVTAIRRAQKEMNGLALPSKGPA